MSEKALHLNGFDHSSVGKDCTECHKLIKDDQDPASIHLKNDLVGELKLPFHHNCIVKGEFLYGMLGECKKIAEARGEEFNIDMEDLGVPDRKWK